MNIKSTEAKKEYLEEIKARYKKADKNGKQRILDEFCATCKYNRKYAIRLLSKVKSKGVLRKKSGRPK